MVRSIKIIGEATKALPEALRLQHDDIPWKEIARMRDNLIHRYFGVRYDIVWQVMQEDIPFLKQRVPQILADVYQNLYLEYKKEITSNQPNSAFSAYLDPEIDKTIAKTIMREYDLKYRQTAIAKVRDILSQSDFARKLDRDRENRLELYLNDTVEKALGDLTSMPERPDLEL